MSPFFAPLANAEAFCGGKMVLQLLQQGVDVTVFCVDYANHYKFSNDSSQLWKPLEKISIKIPPHGFQAKYRALPLAIQYRSVEWARWIGTVVRQVQQHHRLQPFDIIYSRGIPNIAHIASFWIARNLDLPWIANFNDPWDLEGSHLLPQHREHRKQGLAATVSDWWLPRVLQSADMCTFPCERLRDYHLRLLKGFSKTSIFPHVGSSVKISDIGTNFCLLHAGNLGSGESTRRNATLGLLKGLDAFLHQYPDARPITRLMLVGPEDPETIKIAQEFRLESNLKSTGKVSYEQSLRHIAAASVCILVEGNMPEGIYLPSKLADYLVSGKSVLALSPAVGTVADLSSFTGIKRVDSTDVDGIAGAIADYYRVFLKNGLSDFKPSAELVSLFSGNKIAGDFNNLLEELCRHKSDRSCGGDN